jgi:hypothetical protein
VAKVKEELEKNSKIVTGTTVVESPCIASQLKVGFAKNRKAIEEAQAILVLSCGSGVQSVFENNRFSNRVLPGCDTLFASAIDATNIFREYCSHCGECILDLTAGICPVTRCAKGILNGPCGGMNKGKCEIDKESDCAWVLIWKQAEKQGTTAELKKILSAKDHSKALKPHKLIPELENA